MDITSLFLHISTTDICVVVAGVPGGRRAWKRIFQTGKHNTENIGSCSTLILLSMAHSKDREKQHFNLNSTIKVKSYKCHPLLLGMMSFFCISCQQSASLQNLPFVDCNKISKLHF